MSIRIIGISVFSLIFSAASVAQTAEFTKKLNGSLEISELAQAGNYQLMSSGVPSIDQGLGTLVESWRFANQQANGASTSNKAEFIITLNRVSLSDQTYTVKRVELFQKNARIQAHSAASADELAYCKQDNAAPKLDVICPAVMPNDPDLAYSAEVYVAIKKTDAEPLVGIESLYLYSPQNSKLITKYARNAKEKYTAAALAWARKNSQSFLQNKEVFLARVEFVVANNTSAWRRQENWADKTDDWINDGFRAETKYVSQGSWEILGK